MARPKKAENLADSEVLNDATDVESEMTENVPDMKPDWMFHRGMTVLKIEDGVLTVLPWDSTALEREAKKNNWFYRIKTADDRFAVIDYDKDKARPYVKALLAKVNRLREVKLLYFVLGIVILQTFGLITVIVQNSFQSSTINKIAETPASLARTAEKPLPKPSEDFGALEEPPTEKKT